MRKDPADSTAPGLDLDTILGGFPGYIKTECFSYDDSGFDATGDQHKDDDQQLMSVQQLQLQLQLQQQQQQHECTQSLSQPQTPNPNTSVVLTNSLEAGNVITYHNNNNSWHIPESSSEQVMHVCGVSEIEFLWSFFLFS
jgi:hypothetical protein